MRHAADNDHDPHVQSQPSREYKNERTTVTGMGLVRCHPDTHAQSRHVSGFCAPTASKKEHTGDPDCMGTNEMGWPA